MCSLQIVMRYYGGREISEEDLEKALLVGMSPHERRRLERKKGLSFKHSKGSTVPDAEQEKLTSSLATSEMSGGPEVYTPNDGSCNLTAEDIDLYMAKDADVENTFESNSGTHGKTSVEVEKNVNLDCIRDSDTKNVSVVKADNSCERIPSNEKVDFCFTTHDGIAHPKHKSKLSLLGHGPHGKQVVDHLLKEYGDDGVRQFCQRWRQVFVEAVHPRFLPAGWDVMHRYVDHTWHW